VLLCFIKPILWNRYGAGVIPIQGTWGGLILTLHLNYVAGYTGPLLFLLERCFFFFLGFESTQLARRVQPKRTQMEAQ